MGRRITALLSQTINIVACTSRKSIFLHNSFHIILMSENITEYTRFSLNRTYYLWNTYCFTWKSDILPEIMFICFIKICHCSRFYWICLFWCWDSLWNLYSLLQRNMGGNMRQGLKMVFHCVKKIKKYRFYGKIFLITGRFNCSCGSMWYGDLTLLFTGNIPRGVFCERRSQKTWDISREFMRLA